MKKILILTILSIAFTSIVSALPYDFFIGVEPVYTLQNGVLDEFVFVKNKSVEGEPKTKESELNWDLSSISYLGGKVTAGWKFLSLEAQISGAIPNKNGSMIDRDWLDYSGSYCYNDTEMNTNWSKSENTLNSGFKFDIKLKADFNPFAELHLLPFAGYDYYKLNFSARNGYGYYGNKKYTGLSVNVPYDNPAAVYLKKGKLYGIDYERWVSDFYLGFSAGYKLFDRVTVSAFGTVSPYIYVQSIDFHQEDFEGSTGTYFYDIMSGFFKQFSFGGSVDCSIWKGLSADIGFNYYILNLTEGVTYSNSIKKFSKSNKSTASTSGCSGKWWELNAGFKWTF